MYISNIRIYKDIIPDPWDPHNVSLTNVEFTVNHNEESFNLFILFDHNVFNSRKEEFLTDEYLKKFANQWIQRKLDGHIGYLDQIRKPLSLKYFRECLESDKSNPPRSEDVILAKGTEELNRLVRQGLI